MPDHRAPAPHLFSRHGLILMAAAAATLLLGACAANTGKPIGAPSGTNGPQPGLPKHEYPFDSSGKYRTDWVRR
ncbi:MAG: hypothetical protein AAF591_16535 [Verrucomicrobiota bacterium]